jgi:DNA invertase Pin-like site-specific DNA recombinase
MRAFPYLRVSGKTQVDGDGPDRQLEKITAFCAKHSLNQSPEATFDAGVSGAVEGRNRPALKELFEKAQTGDAIVVERMDRLARDLMVQEMFLYDCREKGIKVFSSDGDLRDVASNEGDPSIVFMRQIFGAVAQFVKSMDCAKMQAGAKKKREETGRCGGVLPYGGLGGEKELLDKMLFLWNGAQLSLSGIAAAMNGEQHRTRSGKEWTKQRVHNAIARHTGAKL